MEPGAGDRESFPKSPMLCGSFGQTCTQCLPPVCSSCPFHYKAAFACMNSAFWSALGKTNLKFLTTKLYISLLSDHVSWMAQEYQGVWNFSKGSISLPTERNSPFSTMCATWLACQDCSRQLVVDVQTFMTAFFSFDTRVIFWVLCWHYRSAGTSIFLF